MTRLISLIIFTWGAINAVAQCDLSYKQLSAFGTDTTAFMVYNFCDRADCYEGKTFGEIYNELQAPIKYIMKSTKNSNIVRLYICIYNDTYSQPIYICWEKEENADADLPSYEKNIYDKYKNNKVKKIGIILSSNNRNYTKSASSEELPRGYIKNGRIVYRWKTGH